MDIEQKIEFNKIKEMWGELAITDGARELIAETTYFLHEGQLRKSLKDTGDSRELIEKLGMPPLQNLAELKEVLAVVGRDECLSPYQLERIETALVAMRRLKDYLQRGKNLENSLAYYAENLDGLEELREEISRQIRGGEVDDYASSELGRLRKQIVRCSEEMKQRAEAVMRTHKEYMADTFCTLRGERVCVPVKKEYKLRVPGVVVDKSSTGSTLFIEPAGVAKYYEELQQLRIQEEDEIYRILYTLTAMVAEVLPSIEENIRVMEKMDYIFSKGKLSLDMGASAPQLNTSRMIRLRDARHPLMDRAVNVPLQIELGGEHRGIIITGPNTGGKTVAIKTVMLICMMAQCGLHVPCKEADICMNSSYLCDIGDGQNLAENLSTFSAHIKNVLEVLEEINKDSLVIMDELGSGTDPAEGMGIAIAILEELRKSEALFLVTTHYPEVKEYARRAEGVVNARMTFDKETLRPTYHMVVGEAGESCAFHIAERLGMPVEMLRVAVEAAYGEKALQDSLFYQRAEELQGNSQQKRGKNADLQGARKGSRLTTLKTSGGSADLSRKFHRGDSVMIYPDKKLGIVCEPVNERGVLRVQLQGKKIWINHKRVKLQVAATELYPEDYDFSIIFDTVENRKIRHDMNRKYTEEIITYE